MAFPYILNLGEAGIRVFLQTGDFFKDFKFSNVSLNYLKFITVRLLEGNTISNPTSSGDSLDIPTILLRQNQEHPPFELWMGL